ncbi:HK97 family phage prohead protease [Gordonia sp. MMO-8]|uniref:HK97 family phage prohead protease n=1 Tax=Gordonia sp. MMO-8 TaxID=3127886 RepID=UPI003017097C
MSGVITVVTGPPASGKSTHVREHAEPGDIVVDFDVLATAFGSPDRHDAPKDVADVAFAARNAAIEQILDGVDADAWIIHTQPKAEWIAEYKAADAVFVEIDPGLEACLKQAEDDGRPEWTADVIRDWYRQRNADDTNKTATPSTKGAPAMSAVQTRDARMKIKAAGEPDGLAEGEIEAYASIFGNVDSYGDIVAAGAFATTLKKWEESDRVIPLLYGHNMSDPMYNIGGLTSAIEDEKGLRVKAAFDLDNPIAAQVYKLVKGRRLSELSFAFDVVSSTDEGQTRVLKELDLFEVSIVVVGANPATEIVAVKSAIAGLKAGRAISAKNETHLREAQESMKSAIDVIDSVLATEAQGSPSAAEGDDESPKMTASGPLAAEYEMYFS